MKYGRKSQFQWGRVKSNTLLIWLGVTYHQNNQQKVGDYWSTVVPPSPL